MRQVESFFKKVDRFFNGLVEQKNKPPVDMAYSHIGRDHLARNEPNQDRAHVGEFVGGQKWGLIADGVGGIKGGEFASQTLLHYVNTIMSAHLPPTSRQEALDLVTYVFREAHNYIQQECLIRGVTGEAIPTTTATLYLPYFDLASRTWCGLMAYKGDSYGFVFFPDGTQLHTRPHDALPSIFGAEAAQIRDQVLNNPAENEDTKYRVYDHVNKTYTFVKRMCSTVLSGIGGPKTYEANPLGTLDFRLVPGITTTGYSDNVTDNSNLYDLGNIVAKGGDSANAVLKHVKDGWKGDDSSAFSISPSPETGVQFAPPFDGMYIYAEEQYFVYKGRNYDGTHNLAKATSPQEKRVISSLDLLPLLQPYTFGADFIANITNEHQLYWCLSHTTRNVVGTTKKPDGTDYIYTPQDLLKMAEQAISTHNHLVLPRNHNIQYAAIKILWLKDNPGVPWPY